MNLIASLVCESLLLSIALSRFYSPCDLVFRSLMENTVISDCNSKISSSILYCSLSRQPFREVKSLITVQWAIVIFTVS